MIEVTDEFEIEVAKLNNNPEYEVWIDWNLDGNYSEETEFVQSVSIERNLAEPLGGVVLAQCDVTFVSLCNRMTPRKGVS